MNELVLGSVIFAVEQLGVRLVLVLGHTHCTVIASAVHKWATQRSHAVLDKVTAQALAADLQNSPNPHSAHLVGRMPSRASHAGMQ